MTTPKSGITEMSQSQGNKHVTHNDAVRSLEQGARFFTVIDKDLTTPPASPADGDAYYVPSGASAPWDTHEGEIAYSSGGGADSWKYIELQECDVVYPQDENVFYRNESSALVQGQILNTTFQFKQPVRVATTANGTLASDFENGDTVDGVVLATGDRILLKDQSTGSQNGIYTVNASGAPTRATDADTSAKVKAGMAVIVEEGNVNADKLFILTTNNAIVLGTTALSFSSASANGELRSVQIFTSSDTWTKPANLVRVVVEVLGAGGGGGGAVATAATTASAGAGGAAGGKAIKLIEASVLGATETVTIGSGGSGGSGASGAAGGNSSFGSHATGNGGGGGGASSAGGVFSGASGSSGGTASDGDINVTGNGGHIALRAGTTDTNSGLAIGGFGAGSAYGGGGAANLQQASGADGNDAGGFGAGGGGAANGPDEVARDGGDGTDGIVIVWEYF